jgi:uncharacterized protein YkwD
MKIQKGIAVALAAAILASGGGVATSLATAQPAQAASSQSEIQAAITQILNETNAERANAGLAPLTLNADINVVAQNWTESMATQQSMIHNPDYQTQMPQPWIRVGENVGQGYTKDTIVAAWMASPGHRANILGDFTHIGIGYWVDDAGRGWFTQDFGKYEVPVLTAPNTPVTTVGKFDLTATWDRKWEENVDSYRAELRAQDGTLLQTKIVPVNDGTVTFDGLTDMTTYNVSVLSQYTNALGEQFVSPATTVTVTTLEDIPTVTAVTDLALTPGEDNLGVYWNAPADSNGALQPYTVELLKNGVVVQTAQTTDTSFSFAGLTSNTDYSVNVTATTAVRAKTATATATVSGTTLLSSVANVSEPTNVSTTSESFSTITATWGAPASQTGIDLKYIVTLSTAGKPDVVVETTNPSYTFSGLNQNTDYSVKVQANITSENRVNTSTTNGVTSDVRTLADYNAVDVTAPVLAPVKGYPTSAALSWTAPETVVGNLDAYTIRVKEAGQDDRVFMTTDTNFVVTGLLENHTYSFEVTANASSLNGNNKAEAVSATEKVTTPYAPNTVIVSAPNALAVVLPQPSEVDVTWEAPTTLVGTLDGYKVVLKKGDTVVQTVNTPELKATFTGLESATQYTVEVTANATSPDRTVSAESAVTGIQFSTEGAQVTAPSEVQLSDVTYNSLTTTWTTPDVIVGKLTKYGVTVKQNGSVLGSYFTNDNFYTVTGLKSNTAYTVEVQAFVSSYDGLSEEVSPVASNTVVTQKSPLVSVTAPTTSVSDVKANGFTVSWTRPVSTGLITGYRVLVTKDGKAVQTIPVSMLTTSATVTGLDPEIAYTVTVEATAMAEDNVNTATATSLPTVVTTDFVPVNPGGNPPVVTPPVVTPPVVTPETPGDTSTGGIKLDLSGTPAGDTETPSEAETQNGDPASEETANLANTGVSEQAAPMVAGTGLALLLAAFGFLFAGRIRQARQR